MTPLAESGKLQELLILVDKFRSNLSQYTDKNYKEQRLRMDFVDKLFELLDWDISNKEGAIEEFRDVVIEDNLEISGAQKYPDYTFRLGNEPVFFVETKKPAIYLKDSVDPAYQVRRYGYSAKRKISILTDFQEFAIYDTRIKPGKNDKAAVARLFYCTYEEYEKNWEFLHDLLAKDAVKRGSINKYAGPGTRRGSAEVDKDFLALIEKWRSELAKNIAKNNKKTDLDGINKAVQKIIDRIIFLRICEEKGIEQFENLKNIGSEKRVYENLVIYFDRANKKYNSELFKPGKAIDSLDIDGEILGGVIKALYYPECPYAFSVLPVEILGNIYEQFLGKTIRLTESHLAKIEEKPEVRKAGGVYYTPKYIVDYIVRNTVGEKVQGLAPQEIEKIKILDPACGSGSFLLGAYSYLLDYLLSYYSKKDRLAKALKDEKIYQARANSYHLTIREKQNILLNNIFGVDIDAQAVEVTKLSLMLKLLEGESEESAGKLFKYSDEKLLPTLSNNIKCGNSLIGSDFYKDKNLSLFGDEEMKKINVFDWDDKEKGFGGIMARGGFDCVIGNPPYVKARDYDKGKEFYRDYLNNSKNYKTLYKMWDLFIPFVEKGVLLLSKNGKFGMIIPDTIEYSDYSGPLRKWLIENYFVRQIDFFPNSKIFYSNNRAVGVKNAIIVVDNTHSRNKTKKVIHNADYTIVDSAENVSHDIEIFKQNAFETKLSNVNCLPLGEICFTSYGLRLNSDKNDKMYSFKKVDLLSDVRTVLKSRKYTEGKYLKRYYLHKTKWLEWDSDRCPGHLVRPTFPEMYKPEKLLLGRQTKVAVYDNQQYIVDNTIIVCTLYYLLEGVNNRNIQKYYSNMGISREKLEATSKRFSLKYILGIINSKSVKSYISQLIQKGIDMFPDDWKKIPIPDIPINQQIPLENLVDQMLETQKLAHSAKTENDKKNYQQRIEILDRQIDDLVYDLYGLTPEDIKVVEGEG